MTPEAFWIVYAAGWLITASIGCASAIREAEGDFEYAVPGVLISAVAAVIWPLAVPVGIAYGAGWLIADRLDRREQAAEDRELARRERAATIARLERELGIGRDR